VNDMSETTETEPIVDTEARDDTAAAETTEATEATGATTSALPTATPRVRVGAIAWGLVVCIIAATILAIVTDTARSIAVATWLGSISTGNIWMIVLILAGALTLLIGVASFIGQAQRNRRR